MEKSRVGGLDEAKQHALSERHYHSTYLASLLKLVARFAYLTDNATTTIGPCTGWVNLQLASRQKLRSCWSLFAASTASSDA